MSDDQHPIQPRKVALATVAPPRDPATAAEAAGATARSPVNRVLLAGGAAISLLALYVVFVLLPGMAERARSAEAPASQTQAATEATAPDPRRGQADATEPATQTPYQAAVDDAQRDFAREILAAIVAAQARLEVLRVDLWGGEEFTYAVAIGAEGDAAFALGQLDKARDRYSHALALLQALQVRAQELTDASRTTAEQALVSGDVSAARSAIELLASMYRNDPDIAHLRARFEVMPQVLSLMDDADLALRNQELEAALAGFTRARELDPDRDALNAAIGKVQAQLRDREFRSAMSRGFTAVTRAEFATAESAFAAAAKLRPDSAELAEGRNQLANARTLARIATQRSAALDHMNAEDWPAAVSAFDAALAIDGSLAFALQGRRTALGWQDIEARMRRFIDDPGVLSDENAYREAVAAFADATRLEGAGPRVTALLDRLERLLQVAGVAVPVTFHSDNATDVVVYRVARLGRFDRQRLELRPGRYTVVGTRNGFRDVRVEIVVAADMAPVDIRCVEALAAL